MRYLPRSLAVGAMLLSVVTPALASNETVSFQIVLDNSAALMRAEDAEDAKKRALYHIGQLRKKRAYRDGTINIIGTNNPRNLWFGSPKKLFRNGKAVLEKLPEIGRASCRERV